VTAVGGTTLTQTSAGRGWSEVAWNNGGSGCSIYEPKPTWQNDPICKTRMVADIAAVAKNLAVYDTFGQAGWFPVGGTSASAPIVAGIFGLGGSTNGVSDLYAHAADLFDVTTGNNGSCSNTYLCTAGPGYDGPTGLGTPCGAGAFGPSFATLAPDPGCAASASSSSAMLSPSAENPLTDYVPACRTAPPGYAHCFAYYQPSPSTTHRPSL
jgi:hypothetical protein